MTPEAWLQVRPLRWGPYMLGASGSGLRLGLVGRGSDAEDRSGGRVQEPQHLMDPSASSAPLRRRRQERTVYSRQEQQELESHFANCKYPAYEERKALAVRLHLNEHQVQVWFKNRRAKHFRQMRLEQQGQRPPGQLGGRPGAPGAPGSYAGGPAPAPAGPEFPGGAGVRSLPRPNPSGIFAPAAPGVSSQGPSWGTPAQGALQSTQPAPGPSWAQDPYDSGSSTDPELFPDFTELLEPLNPYVEFSPIPTTSGYQGASDFVQERVCAPRHH
ncbi:tetrapeptide repeat homeobox protein 2-like [Tamandua tetradactyla]|uniref:tetrapeptide repeat homeobox protein 2-like n=1 Tax=Tamandua tetradactyla TaxID=48850 RepID=UPI004053B9E5